MNPVAYQDISISSGQTKSSAIDIGFGQLLAICLPATMTGATITFEASDTSTGTFSAVRKAGDSSDYSITVVASKWITLDPTVFVGLKCIKLVSASAEGADRTIKIAMRRIN